MLHTRRKKPSAVKRIIFLFVIVCFFFALYSVYKRLTRQLLISPLPSSVTDVRGVKTQIKNTTFVDVLKENLSKNDVQFSDIQESSGSAYLVKLSNGSSVLFSAKKDAGGQVSTLQVVSSRLTIEGKGFSLLDLRFDNPVIVFK